MTEDQQTDAAIRRAAAALHAALQSPPRPREVADDTPLPKVVPQAPSPVPRSTRPADVRAFLEQVDDYLLTYPGNLMLVMQACASVEALHHTITAFRREQPSRTNWTWQDVRARLEQRFAPKQDPAVLVQHIMTLRQEGRSLADHLALFERQASEIDVTVWPHPMRISTFLNSLSNSALSNALRVDKLTDRSDWHKFVAQLLDTAHRLSEGAAGQPSRHGPAASKPAGQVHAVVQHGAEQAEAMGHPAQDRAPGPATATAPGTAEVLAAMAAQVRRLEEQLEAVKRSGGQGAATAARSQMRCFNCQQLGHIRRNCRNPPASQSQRPNGQSGAQNKPPDPQAQ
jgi:hypothetical protein